MRTYTFTHTNLDGSKRVEVIEAKNVTEALAIYRQRLKETI
jgi:hypothetical protein